VRAWDKRQEHPCPRPPMAVLVTYGLPKTRLCGILCLLCNMTAQRDECSSHIRAECSKEPNVHRVPRPKAKRHSSRYTALSRSTTNGLCWFIFRIIFLLSPSNHEDTSHYRLSSTSLFPKESHNILLNSTQSHTLPTHATNASPKPNAQKVHAVRSFTALPESQYSCSPPRAPTMKTILQQQASHKNGPDSPQNPP
jgi:hypothetical protein